MIKTTLFSLLLIGTLISQNNENAQGPGAPPDNFKSLEMSNLCSNWIGNGVSFITPKTMHILTRKIQQQVGSLVTYTKMPGGANWMLNSNIILDCINYSHDMGVALWITANNPKTPILSYTFKNYAPTFGMIPDIRGLMVLYTHNAINVGFYNKQALTRDDLLFKSKSCKIYGNEDKMVQIRVKYSNFNNLGVYTVDTKTGIERLCV